MSKRIHIYIWISFSIMLSIVHYPTDPHSPKSLELFQTFLIWIEITFLTRPNILRLSEGYGNNCIRSWQVLLQVKWWMNFKNSLQQSCFLMNYNKTNIINKKSEWNSFKKVNKEPKNQLLILKSKGLGKISSYSYLASHLTPFHPECSYSVEIQIENSWQNATLQCLILCNYFKVSEVWTLIFFFKCM